MQGFFRFALTGKPTYTFTVGGIAMKRMSTCEIRQKDVINVCDGTNLGCATDFEIDTCDGKITALIVPRPSGFLWMSHDKDLVIPWCNIECIGEDTILVKLPPELACRIEKKKEKRKGIF